MLKRANARKVADSRDRTGTVKKTAVSRDKWAIELYGERQERSIVECEIELSTEACRPLEERCRRWGNDKRESFQII
jgi:hypothetical protein